MSIQRQIKLKKKHANDNLPFRNNKNRKNDDHR